MKYLTLTTLVMLLTSNNLAIASPSKNITLQTAIDLAYQNNEEIKAQESSLAASGSLKTKAWAGGFLPRISVDINHGDKKYKIGTSKSVNGDVDTRDINISENLFSGGKNIFDFKRAKSLEEKERYNLMSKRQDIVLQVIKSYADILKYNDLLEMGKENIKSYEQILDYTKKKMKARDVSKADLARAEADYISAVSNQFNTNNNLFSAQANFIKLTGMRKDELSELAKFSLSKIDRRFDKLNQTKIENSALQNNPDLKAAEHNHNAAKLENLMAKSSLSPTATLNYQSSEDKKSIFFNDQTQRNDSVFINFHIPLFSSGTEYADIGYTRNKAGQEKYIVETVRKKIIEASSLYLNEMNNLNHSYRSAIELENANQIYFDSTRREEQVGTKSVLDLLISKQQFYKSQTDRVNNYYDYIMAVFKLEALIGTLSDLN